MKLQAVVFDFDGVLADSEPLHLRALQDALAARGVALGAEEYFAALL
ncbi:MAG: HAD family hydrolase, partial [Vicinamibacterales bacterium]